MWQGYNLTTNIASITIPSLLACFSLGAFADLSKIHCIVRERERERERQREEGGERLRVYPSVVAAAASKFD